MGDLLDYYIVLALVVDRDDPLRMGRVRCHIPGVIHSYSTDVEALPWIRPFMLTAYQSFISPEKNQKVWVLANRNNLNEFWWFPYYELNDTVQNFVSDNYDSYPDVIHERHCSYGDCMITFTQTQGYNIQVGDGCHLSIVPKNNLAIKSDNSEIVMENGNLKLGDSQKLEDKEKTAKAVNADKLINFFKELDNLFERLQIAANSQTLTSHLVKPIGDIRSKLKTVKDGDIGFDNLFAT